MQRQKILKKQGIASLPALKIARQTAAADTRKMIDDIITAIEENAK